MWVYHANHQKAKFSNGYFLSTLWLVHDTINMHYPVEKFNRIFSDPSCSIPLTCQTIHKITSASPVIEPIQFVYIGFKIINPFIVRLSLT